MAKLCCLMGLPGAGKSAVMYRLHTEYLNDLIILPRVTDRGVRQDELSTEENPEYSFQSKRWFKVLQRNGAFAAIENLGNYHYAVREDDIQRVCNDGCPGIVMAGYCGLDIQKKYPKNVFSIFLSVPKVDFGKSILTSESEQDLILRMQQRGDSEERIRSRINLARKIIEVDKVHKNSDLVILNEYGKFEETVKDIITVLL